MENTQEDNLRFPIGPFERKEHYAAEELDALITAIAEMPLRYKLLLEMIDTEDLQKTYRPGAWNVLQLVHHVADIQLLHLLRMKKALTEPDYREVTLINMDGWAATADGRDAPAADSLLMLESITRRYVLLLRSLTDEQLTIEYYHPVRKYTINQAQAIAMSAWHLEHHLAHIGLAIS